MITIFQNNNVEIINKLNLITEMLKDSYTDKAWEEYNRLSELKEKEDN